MSKKISIKKRSVGKPRAAENTIRLLGGKNQVGIARLSANLAKVGDKFTVAFAGSKIFLKRSDMNFVVAYASNPSAKSPLISLMGTLAAMGIPREVQSNLAGIYKAVVNNGVIEFDLDRELK